MSDTTETPIPSAAADRMRRSRERRRKGLRCIPFNVRDEEIDNLIELELLDPTHRGDRAAIARALGKLMDKIPFTWWEAALRQRGA
jgi:hypothetical protein